MRSSFSSGGRGSSSNLVERVELSPRPALPVGALLDLTACATVVLFGFVDLVEVGFGCEGSFSGVD